MSTCIKFLLWARHSGLSLKEMGLSVLGLPVVSHLVSKLSCPPTLRKVCMKLL